MLDDDILACSVRSETTRHLGVDGELCALVLSTKSRFRAGIDASCVNGCHARSKEDVHSLVVGGGVGSLM